MLKTRAALALAACRHTAAALQGIAETENYFRKIGMPVSLEELGVFPDDDEVRKLAMDATMGNTVELSRLKPLSADEVYEIYQMAK